MQQAAEETSRGLQAADAAEEATMLTWSKAALAGASALFTVGCATPGTRPDDMGVAAHETAAATASAEAAEHSALFDPTQATRHLSTCFRAPCSIEVNPTAVHRDHARELEAVAAQHRAAAGALRAEESRACADLAKNDPASGPFFRKEDVTSVEPLYAHSGFRTGAVTGAVIALSPRPGVSAEDVQKRLDCHLARKAAAGINAAEMALCPLAGRGVRATAFDDDGRVIVEIKAPHDGRTANEVFRRAQLVARN